ncbi:MAG TPA: ABC transporter permease, partial [Ilumatobacteraceae bacterium]|nr:ABC transporter permease [Ilumatobacteraceae bacterium]
MNTTTTLVSSRRLDVTTSPSSRRRDLRLAVRQIGFEQRAFWRNRARAFFSVGLPLMFLVVFNALNGSHHIDELGGITYATWFVPGILAYGLMMATFSNLAISITVSRDTGVLKRLRGTSLPTWVYIAARVGSTVITAATLVAATLGLGATAYGVHIRL